MGTVGNMQSLKPLVLLILGLCFVKGDYWWMGEGDAFGGNSDTQVKRASCGGYGGGCGSKKTQTVGGYPQNGAINTQNTGSYPQNNGGYPQNAGGYPQNAGGYPQNTGGYPSNSGGYPQSGGISQSNENINSVNSIPNSSREKIQDISGGVCPTGLVCLAESECNQPRGSALQERVANYIQCGQNRICCGGNTPAVTDPFAGSGSSLSSSTILQQNPGNNQLPETQCSQGWKCVSDLFCDASATMVQFRVELTQAERSRRGQLTPCMNQFTQQFDVCCRKPVVLPEQNEIDNFQRQELKPTTCPVINVLPPIEQCGRRPSNCWSVGLADTDCIGNGLCCFDGCANVCQGEGPTKGNPGPQSNARGQQRQQASNNANSNFNTNKPEAFQDLTQQAVNQDFGHFGASSLAFETIKQSAPAGYAGQQLPTQTQPLIQSIQKQQPIKVTPTLAPLLNIIQSAPITDPVQNVLQYDGENSQSAPDNIFNDSQDYPSFNQPRDTPADYPATNTQRIVFPQDDEETSFPTFSQTSLPPYTDTSSSPVSKTQPLTVIQPKPIPVQQQVQVNQPTQASVQQPVQVIQPIPVQQPVQVIQPNPIPLQQPVQAAASQPFITCPSAMKCVQKITCNFNGVMVEEQVQLTALQGTQRVPLIPCFNPSRSNAVDVCCRYPNYKDPWPASQNGQQQQFNSGQYNGQQQQQFNSRNENIKQQQFNDNLRQEEQGSGLFQDSSSTFVRTAVPKKRKTHGYGK